jgi:sulfite exporter TauE/SafE
VSAEFNLSFAFLTGVLGAFHCLGMCIGVNGAFHAGRQRQPKFLDVAGFHGMRIIVYTVLGVTGAAVGQVIVQSGFVGKAQALIMMLAGLVLIFFGFRLGWRRKGQAASTPRTVTVELTTNQPKKRDRFSPLVAGMFNGMVPCSLVSLVAIQGAATGSPVQAGMMMLAFGAGTLPTLMTLSLLGGLAGYQTAGWWVRLLGIAVVIAGGWTFHQGYVVYDIIRGLANW